MSNYYKSNCPRYPKPSCYRPNDDCNYSCPPPCPPPCPTPCPTPCPPPCPPVVYQQQQQCDPCRGRSYGFFYTTNNQILGAGQPIIWTGFGTKTDGITYDSINSPSQLTVNCAGDYDLEFTVTASDTIGTSSANGIAIGNVLPGFTFAIYVNNNLVPFSIFTSRIGGTQIKGQLILSLCAGDVVALRNISGGQVIIECSHCNATNALGATIKLVQLC